MPSTAAQARAYSHNALMVVMLDGRYQTCTDISGPPEALSKILYARFSFPLLFNYPLRSVSPSRVVTSPLSVYYRRLSPLSFHSGVVKPALWRLVPGPSTSAASVAVVGVEWRAEVASWQNYK